MIVSWNWLTRYVRLDMPVERVDEIYRIAPEPLSLETPIGEEEDSHLSDFVEDQEAMSPSEAPFASAPPSFNRRPGGHLDA